MSAISTLEEFKSMLLAKFKASNALIEKCSNIYFHIQKNAETPCIVVTNFKTESKAKLIGSDITVFFDILVFHENLSNAWQIADITNKNLLNTQAISDNFIVISLVNYEVNIQDSHDLNIKKIHFKYKALCQG